MKQFILCAVLMFGLSGNAHAGGLFFGGWGGSYSSYPYYSYGSCCGSSYYSYPGYYSGYQGWESYPYNPQHSYLPGYVTAPQVRTYFVPLATPSAPVPRIVHKTKGVEVEKRTVTGHYNVKSWGADGKSFTDENGSPWRLIVGSPVEPADRGAQVIGYISLVQHEDLTRRSYLHIVEWNAEAGEWRPTGVIWD